MVAYNFQERFARLVESGEKKQTIRRIGSKNPPKVGDKIQLYTKMMRKECRKLLSPDPACTGVYRFQIRIVDYIKQPDGSFLDRFDIQKILLEKTIGGERYSVRGFSAPVLDSQFLLPSEVVEFCLLDGFDSVRDMADWIGKSCGVGSHSFYLVTWE